VQRRGRAPEVVRRDDGVTELRIASEGPDYKALAGVSGDAAARVRAWLG
jgi:hypothetical protein